MKRNDNKNDEIDLIELFLDGWKERKYLLYSLGVFFILGFVIAFTSNEEYTSEVKLIPEGSPQSVSMGLAQQFGIREIPAATNEGISSRIYPDIARSIPFLLSILDYEVYVPEISSTITIFEYFDQYHSEITFTSRVSTSIKKYTLRLPITIMGWLNQLKKRKEPIVQNKTEIGYNSPANNIIRDTSNLINISRRELRVINALRGRITVERGDALITIIVKMPDPNMAADIVNYVTTSFNDYIKNYRTEKAKIDVDFIEERYEEARSRFELDQQRLASFRDQNRGQLTQIARTQEQRLQSAYELSFNIYNTLARRLEEARLKLQEETPIVRVLEPAIVPTSASEPKREFILTIYLILGFIAGVGFIILKLVWRRIRDTIKDRQTDNLL